MNGRQAVLEEYNWRGKGRYNCPEEEHNLSDVDRMSDRTLQANIQKRGNNTKPYLWQGNKGLISHLKHDHRMIRNYLSGTAGDRINTLLAATAYNMRKWMQLNRQEILDLIFRWFLQTLILVPVNIKTW